MRPAELSPKRVWMDDADCERMSRSEIEAMRGLLGAVSYTATAKENLQKRLGAFKHGKQRMAMALGALKALADDLIGTMPVGQCKQIRNTMKDMEIRIVPRMMPMSQNVILDKDIAKGLIDIAQQQCRDCVEDAVSCRKCSLYKVLESAVPVDNYDDSLVCPYAISEWKD